MPLTWRFSTMTTWFLLTSLALSLCRKSCRLFATRSCTLATDFLAFLRELLPSFLRANFCCLRLRFCWCFTKCWGFSNLEILVPSATIAKCFNPKSIPAIFPELEISGFSPSISNKIAAKYLPEGFWLTVTVLIFPSIGLCNASFDYSKFRELEFRVRNDLNILGVLNRLLMLFWLELRKLSSFVKKVFIGSREIKRGRL